MSDQPIRPVAVRSFLAGRGRVVGHQLIVAPEGAEVDLRDALLSELAEPDPDQPVTFRHGEVAGRRLTVATIEVETVAAVVDSGGPTTDRHGRPLMPVMGFVVDGDVRTEFGPDTRDWLESTLGAMYRDFLSKEEHWTVPSGPVKMLESEADVRAQAPPDKHVIAPAQDQPPHASATPHQPGFRIRSRHLVVVLSVAVLLAVVVLMALLWLRG